MDALTCILTRKSVRKFLPDPAPRPLLEEILEAAQHAPSYRNSQPWEAVVVSGAKKEALSALLTGLEERETPTHPDLPKPGAWPAAIEARMNATMQRRAEAFGMNLRDPEVQKRGRLSNFRFYGAPHGIFLFQDASLSSWSILDIGAFAQTLMLAAHARGLGTVPQAFLTDYAAEVKQFLGIAPNQRLVLGISIGYPDNADPAATFQSGRRTLNDYVTWVE